MPVRGIKSYASYVPRHVLDRAAIRATLGQGGGKGTRSVAGYDEDTTSMAVEAARRARWNGDFTPSSLHFATTAPAYADKTNATAIHAALQLPANVFASDHAGSARAAVGALRAAAADGGLAVLSDVRYGLPGSADEAGGGDAAAAFLFGGGDGDDDGVIAEILSHAAATSEFLDRWRAPGEPASSTWEERFGLGEYLPLIEDAATRALASAGVTRPDVTIVASPHARAARTAAKKLGADDPFEAVTGYTGAAHLGLRLADALDTAEPGQVILAISAADGADAIVLRVTEAVVSRPLRDSAAPV
jgi:3-hydroxy-3-methylglutaryl CoA synthase